MDIAVHGGSLVVKSCLTLANPWSVAHQASLSKGFSRQEYWNGLPFPSPGDLQDPGIEPASPARVSRSAGGFFTGEPPGKPLSGHNHIREIKPEPCS